MAQKSIDEQLKNARLHHQAGRFAAAEPIYREILTRKSDHAETLHLLGALCHQTNRNTEAVELIERAIRISGQKAFWHSNLGNAYLALRKYDKAIASYNRAIELNPKLGDALYNLGNALRALGRTNDAVAAFERAVELIPGSADLHNNLSLAYLDGRQYLKAIASAQKALSLNPNSAMIFTNLGLAFKEANLLDEAVQCFQKAIEIDENLPQALMNIGSVFKEQGRHNEAVACIARAVLLEPDSIDMHNSLVFALHSHPEIDQKILHEEHVKWSKKFAEPFRSLIKPHTNDPDPDRRIRVGYVSGDFRQHVVARFLLPIMRHHDHSHNEIFCYANHPKDDDVTQKLRACADQWRDLYGMPDIPAAEIVRADKIDVLIDLSLFTAGNRLQLFAHKPAPVQATYLAYCSTSGMDTMDYRISDKYMDPPGQDDQHYAEKTVYLPDCYWCYEPPIQIDQAGPLPVLKNGFITFGCFNVFHKISSTALDCWAEILRRVENSRIRISALEGSHRAMVKAHFKSRGVDPERIVFVGRMNLAEYFANYQTIDIALDPFPWGGGTTSCDVLWMGVPMITLAGPIAVARAGVSLLTNIGFPELISRSTIEYVDKAVGLAKDVDRIIQIRQTMRSKMEASPVMDQPRFVRGLEETFRTMWRNWCAERKT